MTERRIAPPQWQMDAWQARIETMGSDVPAILLEIAQWGADQELEACCALMELSDSSARDFLQSARRPKPPSLKKQALIVLDDASLDAAHENIIRRALEQLDD